MRKSLVLLENEGRVLPLRREARPLATSPDRQDPGYEPRFAVGSGFHCGADRAK